jgi:hypothetical protein
LAAGRIPDLRKRNEVRGLDEVVFGGDAAAHDIEHHFSPRVAQVSLSAVSCMPSASAM